MELTLDNNVIQELPQAIGNMSKLRQLALDHNRLSVLPASICDLVCTRSKPMVWWYATLTITCYIACYIFHVWLVACTGRIVLEAKWFNAATRTIWPSCHIACARFDWERTGMGHFCFFGSSNIYQHFNRQRCPIHSGNYPTWSICHYRTTNLPCCLGACVNCSLWSCWWPRITKSPRFVLVTMPSSFF